jgi:hypothetical protein
VFVRDATLHDDDVGIPLAGRSRLELLDVRVAPFDGQHGVVQFDTREVRDVPHQEVLESRFRRREGGDRTAVTALACEPVGVYDVLVFCGLSFTGFQPLGFPLRVTRPQAFFLHPRVRSRFVVHHVLGPRSRGRVSGCATHYLSWFNIPCPLINPCYTFPW